MIVSACKLVLHTTTCFSDCALCEEYDPPSFWRSIHMNANCSNCHRKTEQHRIAQHTIKVPSGDILPNFSYLLTYGHDKCKRNACYISTNSPKKLGKMEPQSYTIFQSFHLKFHVLITCVYI